MGTSIGFMGCDSTRKYNTSGQKSLPPVNEKNKLKAFPKGNISLHRDARSNTG